jgi:ornithine carbamoyltransferase
MNDKAHGQHGPHFLDVDDLSAPALRRVLDRAAGWKEKGKVPDLLSGRAVAALFQKPSARTRVSFEVAVATLGGHCVTLRGEELGLGSRESVADVARTLASYCSVIGARVFDHRVLEEMARVGGVPVINLLSDTAHPGQAVGDLLTLEEHLGGPVEGRRLAFVGDGNNVAASLALAAALTGLEMVIASPSGYELDDAVVERARNLGGLVELVADPYEAVEGADAVYTDVWTSMGQETENEARQAAFAAYQVNADLMAAARPDTLVLHCLPAKRGLEITDDVLDGPNSVVWTQAENRMHSYRSILVELTGEA